MKKKLLSGCIATLLISSLCMSCGVKTEKNSSASAVTSTKENKMEESNIMETKTDVAQKEGKYKVKSETIEIKNGENTIVGDIYMPDSDGKFPAIVMGHGYNGSGKDFKREAFYYASNGYIALSIDFCGGSVNSRSTGKTTDMTVFTEKSDALAAFSYVKSLDNVDPDHIYMFGGSQGGFVASLATEELMDQVKGLILYFPAFCIPDNWKNTYPELSDIPDENDFWGMKLGRNFFESIHDFDVFDNIGKYEGNVLIFHGDKDNLVPIDYSKKAVSIYPHAKLIIMPNEGHGFTPLGVKRAMCQILDFMDENKN